MNLNKINSAGTPCPDAVGRKQSILEKTSEPVITDKVSIGEDRGEAEACPKVFGTVGAMVGVIAGRTAILPGISATVAGAVAGSLLGPVGMVVGAVAGFAVGAYAEGKSRIGRVLGGLAGGAVGIGLGKTAQKFGYKPTQKMVDETRGFTFKSLFKKLQNPEYTSSKTISDKEAQKIMEMAQPGDLIITNYNGNFKFEIVQKLLGHSGDWTHVGIVSSDKTILEVLIAADGGTESKGVDAATRNHHFMLLRPNYKDRQSILETEKAARDSLGVKYDWRFNLKTDDKHYCQEHTYKALQKGSPEIRIEPSKLFGFQYLVSDDFIKSPDTEVVYTTGSNFWRNLMSKFS